MTCIDPMGGRRSRSGWFALLMILVLTRGVAAQHTGYAGMVRTGQEQLRTGAYEDAIRTFEQALTAVERPVEALLGIGTAYYHLKEDGRAEAHLLRVIALDPRASAAYGLLGEIAYRRDDLEQAVASWEKAVAIEPSNAVVRSRLERLRREHAAEQGFQRDVTGHFRAKYEGRERIEAGRIVLRILEDAYGDVGRELSFYPSEEVQVILYSSRQFTEVTDAPGWSAGVFDGKIRIPIGGIEQESPGLRRLLYHEYAHAVIRMITPRVPTWLNEGLAQYFEGRTVAPGQRAALQRLAQEGRLPSLRQLEGSFLGYSGPQAAFAYLYSLSAVTHLIDEFGLFRAKMMLEELAAGATAEKALDTALLISMGDFERSWKESLQEGR